jgi:hypothetical protein
LSSCEIAGETVAYRCVSPGHKLSKPDKLKGTNGKYTWREYKGLDASGKPVYGKKIYEYHPGHAPTNPDLPRNPLREKPHYHRNWPVGPGNKNLIHHVPPPGRTDPHLPPGSEVF